MANFNESFDIIIIGSGPSGSIAGKSAAEIGFSTCIIEKEKLGEKGRYKACGGAIPWEIIDEINYPEDKIARFVESLEHHHIDGEQYSQKGKGAVVWRNIFDKYLLDFSTASGVVLKEGERLIQITKNTHQYEIKTNKSTYKAKYVIAADGVTSTTLKLLGWPFFDKSDVCITTTHEMKASKTYINERLGTNQVHCYFGKKLSTGGYAWLFPKEEVITVGWSNQMSLVKNSSAEFKNFLSFPSIKKVLTNATLLRSQSHLLPAGLRPKLYEDNVIAVGDAGGLVEPIFGEGIGYAMLSGSLAIAAIKKSNDKNEPQNIGFFYEELLNKEFLAEFSEMRELRDKIYESDGNLKKYLSLLEKYLTSEIIARKIF